MRILHLVHDVRDVGNGIVHVAVDTAMYQRLAGHDVAVASGPGEFSRLLVENGVEWYPLPHGRDVRNLVLAGPRLRTIVKRFRPNTVHAHDLSGTLVASMFRCGLNYRLVATAHRVYDRTVTILALADRIIALSQANAGALADAHIPRRKIHIVTNGTVGTLRREEAPEMLPLEVMHPAVVSVAGLYVRKGIDVLIDAFDRLKNQQAHLYIVGEGPDREQFETRVATLPCASRVHFVGFIARPQRYLQACDVFALASRRESFPLVLLEAREAGCAIVATDIDGVKEALDAGSAGLLVPPEDSAELARAIDTLLEDESVMTHYRMAAAQSLDQFSAERMSRETLGVYES